METTRNKSRWLLDKISKETPPNWLCPTCGIGELTFNKDWVKRDRNSSTKQEHPDYISQFPEEQVEHFAGILICSNRNCLESVATLGLVTYEPEYEEYEGRIGEYRVYHPKFFFPELKLFQISKSCPPVISAQVNKSFSHFFNDSSACANAIRTALELIMDDREVAKSYLSSGRRKSYTLHKRIEIFGIGRPELQAFLTAAKWIGNAGSHIGEISKEALFDGYELLEHCIDELYDKKERIKELTVKAKEINKKKKPRMHRKK